MDSISILLKIKCGVFNLLLYCKEDRMKTKLFSLSFLMIVLFFLIFQWGCTDKYKPAPNIFSSSEESSCTHCHLNANLLKEIATPLPHDEGESGEG